MADEKVLRIGVIQGVAVIEERIVRTRGPVSFGTAANNTFVLQGSDLPKSVTLFDTKGDHYQLIFTDETVGRLETAQAKQDLAHVKTTAEKAGDKYRVTLDDASRGRVKLSAEITVLFHFVPAPPVATTVALPSDLRTSIISAIEPIFTAVMLASFLLHSAVAVFVKVVEPPAPADSLEDLRRIVENMVPPPKVEVPKIPLPIDTTINTGPGKGDEPKSTGGGDGDGGGGEPKKGKPGGGGGVGDRAALREQIAGRGILQLIGGRGGGGGGGAVGSVFGSGSAISDDLGSALAGTSGVGVAGAGGGGVTRRGTGGDGSGGDGSGGGAGGGAADIGALATAGGGKVDTGAKSAARIVARVRSDDIEAVDGKIDRKVVKATLQRRADAFQACYEQALKANSKLAGKLVVEFTIGDGGKVTEARVVKDGLGSGTVNQCVLEVLRRLRFPAPDDGEVTIANTFVFQPGS